MRRLVAAQHDGRPGHSLGAALFTNTWQYARRPQENPNGSELWTQDVPMHLASVSKLITAMAMMVLFLDHKLDKGPGRRGPPIIQRIHPWEEAAIRLICRTIGRQGPISKTSPSETCCSTPVASRRRRVPSTFQSIQSAIATGSSQWSRDLPVSQCELRAVPDSPPGHQRRHRPGRGPDFPRTFLE